MKAGLVMAVMVSEMNDDGVLAEGEEVFREEDFIGMVMNAAVVSALDDGVVKEIALDS